MDAGDASSRARPAGQAASLDYTKEKGTGLLVMGAYGHGGLSNFLGLGGAGGQGDCGLSGAAPAGH